MHPSVAAVVATIRAHCKGSLPVFLTMCGMLVAGLRGDTPLPPGDVGSAAARVGDRAALVSALTGLLTSVQTWEDVDAAMQPPGATRSQTQEFSKWMTRRNPFEDLDMTLESTAESPYKPPAARTVHSGLSSEQYVSEVATAIAEQDMRASLPKPVHDDALPPVGAIAGGV